MSTDFDPSLLDNVPASVPPPGQQSNLVDPPSTGFLIVVTVVICLALTVPLLLMRIAARVMGRKKLDWADYASIVAEAGFIAYCGLMIQSEVIGGGRHMWDITVTSVLEGLQYVDILEALYCPVLLIAKLSVLLQIRRIFTGSKKRGFVSIASTALIWTNALFYISMMLVTIFACTPRIKIWNPWLPGTCTNQNVVVLFNAGMNVASDLFILVLPIIATSRLRLPLDQKVKVCAIFAFGSFALVAGIMRLVASINLINNVADFSYELVPLGCWSLGEIATVIAAGCMPSIPQFWTLLSKKFRFSRPTYPSYGSDKATLRSDPNSSVAMSSTACATNSAGSYREKQVLTMSCSISLSKKLVPVKPSKVASRSHKDGIPYPVNTSIDTYRSIDEEKKIPRKPVSKPPNTFQTDSTRVPTSKIVKDETSPRRSRWSWTINKPLFSPKALTSHPQPEYSEMAQHGSDRTTDKSDQFANRSFGKGSTKERTNVVSTQVPDVDRSNMQTPSAKSLASKEERKYIIPKTPSAKQRQPRAIRERANDHERNQSSRSLSPKPPSMECRQGSQEEDRVADSSKHAQSSDGETVLPRVPPRTQSSHSRRSLLFRALPPIPPPPQSYF